MIGWFLPEHARIKAQYQEFGRTQVAPRSQRLYEQTQFDFESWEQLCAMGLWRFAVPKKYGGLDQTWWEFAAAFEGLASSCHDVGFLLSIVAHCGLIRAMLEFGTEAQRRRYLPMLMSGKIGATALTEPSGGSDNPA